MAMLLNAAVTTAVSVVVTTPVACQDGMPHSAAIQAVFSYGSGGTSADAYVQTSIDGGDNWIDVANFRFTTASGSSIVNLSALTAIATPYAITDGSLSANTIKDGILGTLWRVKYTTVGTYAGSTTLRVDASFSGSLDQR